MFRMQNSEKIYESRIRKKNVTLRVELEALSKIVNEKEKQFLGLQVELDHAKERIKQLTIGFVHLSDVINYGRTSNDKAGPGYKEIENEKETTN